MKFNLDRFKQKLGPLPVWAWGLIGGAILVGIYFLYTSRKGTGAVEQVDDGGAAEAQREFEEADNAIGAAEDVGLWTQIQDYIKGLLPASPPENGNDNSVTAPPAPAYSGGGGGWGGSGSAAVPAATGVPDTPVGKQRAIYNPASSSPPISSPYRDNLSAYAYSKVPQIDWGATIFGGIQRGTSQAAFGPFAFLIPGFWDSPVAFEPTPKGIRMDVGLSGGGSGGSKLSSQTFTTEVKDSGKTQSAYVPQEAKVRAPDPAPAPAPAPKVKAPAPAPKVRTPAPAPAPKTSGKSR